MRVVINEVWNAVGKSVQLTVLEVAEGDSPQAAVYRWIAENRPELDLALGINSHGFHAKVDPGKRNQGKT